MWLLGKVSLRIPRPKSGVVGQCEAFSSAFAVFLQVVCVRGFFSSQFLITVITASSGSLKSIFQSA